MQILLYFESFNALTLIFNSHTIFARFARFFVKLFYSMNKTLHRKLTEKQLPGELQTLSQLRHESAHMQEMGILREAAKDLLQPRPEAIANLLKMARELN